MGLFDLLDQREGGGGYDTLYGFSNKDGQQFEGADVSQRTIDELVDWSSASGPYGRWSNDQLGYVSTPMGRGQIVGDTMKHTASAMGIPGDTVFDKNTQDSMINYLADQAIGDKPLPQARSALRGTWEGFGGVSNAKLDEAIMERRQTKQRGVGAAASFANRQQAIATDIQTDMLDARNEANHFENSAALMFASPQQKQQLQALPEYDPIGGTTVQGTGGRTAYGGEGNDTTLNEAVGMEPAPEEEAKAGFDWGGMLEGIGVGLGQISANQPVNMTSVWDRRQRGELTREGYGLDQQRIDAAGKQEARLQRDQQMEIDALTSSKEGKMRLAQIVFDKTGDAKAAQAVIDNDEFAKQIADDVSGTLFPSGGGSHTDEQRSIAAYDDEALRGQVADAAMRIPAFATPDMQQLIRSDARTAMNVGKSITKMFAPPKDQAPPVPRQYQADVMDRTQERINALPASDPRRAVMEEGLTQLQDIYDRGDDPQAFGTALQDYKARLGDLSSTQAEQNVETVADTQDDAAKIAASKAYAETLSPGNEELQRLAEDPNTTNMDIAKLHQTRTEYKDAVAKDEFDVAQNTAVSERFQELANEKRAENPDAAEIYDTAAVYARTGNVDGAVRSIMQLNKDDRPSEIRVAEWAAAASTNDKRSLMDLRLALSGKTRASRVDDINAETLTTEAATVPNLNKLEYAFKAVQDIVRKPDFDSGLITSTLMPVNNIFDQLGFGINLYGDMTDSSLVDGLSNGVIQMFREPNSGVMTDWDGEKIMGQLSAIDKNVDTNRALVQFQIRRIALEKINISAKREYYINGGDMQDSAALSAFQTMRAEEAGVPLKPFEEVTGDSANARDAIESMVRSGKVQVGDMISVNGKLIPYFGFAD